MPINDCLAWFSQIIFLAVWFYQMGTVTLLILFKQFNIILKIKVKSTKYLYIRHAS